MDTNSRAALFRNSKWEQNIATACFVSIFVKFSRAMARGHDPVSRVELFKSGAHLVQLLFLSSAVFLCFVEPGSTFCTFLASCIPWTIAQKSGVTWAGGLLIPLPPSFPEEPK